MLSLIDVVPVYADAVQYRCGQGFGDVDFQGLGSHHVGKYYPLVAYGRGVCDLLPLAGFVHDFQIELCHSLTQRYILLQLHSVECLWSVEFKAYRCLSCSVLRSPV